MKRVCLLLLLSVVCCCAARAQEAGAISEEKRRDIKRLLELTEASKIGQQIISMSLEQLRQSFLALPEAQRERMLKIVGEEMSKGFSESQMVEAMIPIYDKHLTAEEVRQLIAFYETPIGRKLVAVLPAITREGYEYGALLGKQAGLRAMSRIAEEGLLGQPENHVLAPKPAQGKGRAPRRRRP